MTKRIGLTVGFVLWVCAVGASGAQASIVTIGSPLTASFSPQGPDATIIQTALPEAGAAVSAPITGTIVRWRIADASGGPFKLRVVTHVSGITYMGAGTSAPETPASTATQTFSTNLPIQAGQLIALDTASGGKLGFASPSGASWLGYTSTPLADGTSTAADDAGADEWAFNADIQPAPGLTSISPSSGSTAGGTTVKITGHDFQGSTDAVSFGGVAAKSVTVNSDTQITAVSPPASMPASVDVRVTTGAGTTPVVAADAFTYEGSGTPPTPTGTPTPPSHTAITKTNINKLTDRAKFSFTATDATSFECALIKRPKTGTQQPKPTFRACNSPKTYKHLKPGRYIFEVRGVNTVGTDPKPAVRKFKIS